MKYLQHIVPFIFLAFMTSSVSAQQTVNLAGYWEMTSQKVNGKENLTYGKQIKLLTATHFVWVRQNKETVEKLLAKGTAEDSLIAFHDAFGAGTYKVNGNTYTETTEFFYEPQYIGTSIDFTFKLNGDKWYNRGDFVHNENGKKVDEIIEEVWQKVE